jgi:hypothetical protein
VEQEELVEQEEDVVVGKDDTCATSSVDVQQFSPTGVDSSCRLEEDSDEEDNPRSTHPASLSDLDSSCGGSHSRKEEEEDNGFVMIAVAR